MRRALLVIVCLLSLTGCVGLVCGEGTHEKDGECIANVLVKCAEGTVYAQGWCVPAEEDASTDASSSQPDASGAGD